MDGQIQKEVNYMEELVIKISEKDVYFMRINKKYFYKWDGEGLRYEIQEWMSCILNHRFSSARLRRRESIAMAGVMQQFTERKNFMEI